jgi:putative Holliday junction resolvase
MLNILMARILGLDVGDRRIGLALSDPTGFLASPLGIYVRRNQIEDTAYIMAVVQEHEVERVVIGLPCNMNGSEGPQAGKTREFARALAAAGLDVELWDERLTTVEATRLLQERGIKRRRIEQKIDEVAATLILDSYLRSRETRERGQ